MNLENAVHRWGGRVGNLRRTSKNVVNLGAIEINLLKRTVNGSPADYLKDRVHIASDADIATVVAKVVEANAAQEVATKLREEVEQLYGVAYTNGSPVTFEEFEAYVKEQGI